jgi:hypothetical protein
MAGYLVVVNDAVANYSNTRDLAKTFCQHHGLPESCITQIFSNGPSVTSPTEKVVSGVYVPDAQNMLRVEV